MRKLLLVLFIVSTQSQAEGIFQQPDKAAHFMAGVAISVTTTVLIHKYAPDIPAFPRAVMGAVAAGMIGYFKESIDPHFDGADVNAAFMGGLSAAVITIPLDL